MSTTHVAGPPVNYNGRVIQRCAVCGFKLCDSKNAMTPRPPKWLHEGTGKEPPIPTFPTWPERHFVTHKQHSEDPLDRSGSFFVGADFGDPDSETPDDFCIALVED